ncbi:hypothetical protein NGA_0353900, partial [Nannochloropsis gaditana CCMP526]
DKQERDTTPIGWQHPATEEEGTLDRPSSPVAISGFYLFTLELLTIALVFSKALHHNAGKKYVRVVQPGCHVAWADMNGDHSTVACCSLPSSSTTFLSFLLGGDDPPSEGQDGWKNPLCAAATSPRTKHLTSGLALVLPFVTWFLNCLFSAVAGWWGEGGRTEKGRGKDEEGKEGRRRREAIWTGQRRRLGLYAAVIMFRTAVLLMLLNRVQAWVQAEEGDTCWYSALRHDGRCRERFDFADHGVLFISQYLAIQTFETVAILREARSLLHLVTCLASACLISLLSLVGFYDTVTYFHTRTESLMGVLISLVTVQLPLMLVASGRLRQHRYLRISHFIKA